MHDAFQIEMERPIFVSDSNALIFFKPILKGVLCAIRTLLETYCKSSKVCSAISIFLYFHILSETQLA